MSVPIVTGADSAGQAITYLSDPLCSRCYRAQLTIGHHRDAAARLKLLPTAAFGRSGAPDPPVLHRAGFVESLALDCINSGVRNFGPFNASLQFTCPKAKRFAGHSAPAQTEPKGKHDENCSDRR